MHEMSIAQGIMDVVKQEMTKNKMKVLLKVKIRAGKLNAIVPEALQVCFDMLLQDTPWPGAMLEIEITPIKLRCSKCSKEFLPEDQKYIGSIIQAPCPNCGTEIGHKIVSGKELLIEYLEAE